MGELDEEADRLLVVEERAFTWQVVEFYEKRQHNHLDKSPE